MRLANFLRGKLRQIASSRTTTWLVCCGLALSGFVVVCVASLVAARSDVDQRAQTTAASAATIAAYDIAHAIEQLDLAMQATIGRLQSPAVMRLDEPVRNEVLFDRILSLPPVGFVDVLDENGAVTTSSELSHRLSKWGGRDYFVAQRLNPSVGLYAGRPFGHGEYLSIPLSRRVAHDDGTFGGVVVAGFRLNYVRELFQQLTLGAHGSIALLRSDGRVLMRLPFDEDAIDRDIAANPVSGGGRVWLADRQVGDFPLSVRVSTLQDVAGGRNEWTIAVLLAGALLAAVSVALVILLRRERSNREFAEQDNRRKSDYLAMTSQELRAPLQDILDNAEWLHADIATDSASARRLMAIVCAGRRMREAVDRVLCHLRVEAPLHQPRMGRVALEELLEQCCNIVEPDAAARGLGLRYGFKLGAPEQFVTDGDLLRQILVNLVGNAIKFTAHGEVTIEIGGTPDRVTIEVIDTGCGIPPVRHHNLFAGDPAHGIGLAMSRRLVQSLGGDIGFRDNPAGGSIFWIGLPVGKLPQLAPVERAGALQLAVP
jgi:signal transduction histidine kinase